MMMRQLWGIALVLIFLSVSAGRSNAQTVKTVRGWVSSNLPPGVTVQSATCAQLTAAVKAAIKSHPKQAKAIVSYVFSQLTANDTCKALGVVDAIISAVPANEVAALISAAFGSLSTAVDPQTGQSAQSVLTPLITQRALADDPSLASAILAAIGAAPSGSNLQSLGPGNAANPANFSNTNGSVNSPQ